MHYALAQLLAHAPAYEKPAQSAFNDYPGLLLYALLYDDNDVIEDPASRVFHAPFLVFLFSTSPPSPVRPFAAATAAAHHDEPSAAPVLATYFFAILSRY
jgi:hypothetical protein